MTPARVEHWGEKLAWEWARRYLETGCGDEWVADTIRRARIRASLEAVLAAFSAALEPALPMLIQERRRRERGAAERRARLDAAAEAAFRKFLEAPPVSERLPAYQHGGAWSRAHMVAAGRLDLGSRRVH